LDLEKPILDELKALQKREKISLGALASRLLADALSRRTEESEAPPVVRWKSAPMKPRVNLEDKEALYAAIDSPDPT